MYANYLIILYSVEGNVLPCLEYSVSFSEKVFYYF